MSRAEAAVLPAFADVPAGLLPPGPDGVAVPTAGFRLGVVPVTAGQYFASLVERGLHQRPAPALHAFPAGPGLGLRAAPDGAVALDADQADLPVTGVTWRGAGAYCEWLTARIRVPCRLPTAVEWQYAAAGPAGFRWSLGDEFDRDTYAPPAGRPRPVGVTPPNAFGLRDMTGNVFEWCADPLLAPSGAELGSRVIKGGGYTVRNPESFENATVFTADELSTLPYIGFRVLSAGS